MESSSMSYDTQSYADYPKSARKEFLILVFYKHSTKYRFKSTIIHFGGENYGKKRAQAGRILLE